MVWAKNGTPNTLTGTADDIDITDLTANTFNQFLWYNSGSNADQATTRQTFNNNDNSVYANRTSTNGAADATAVSQAFQDYAVGVAKFGDVLSVQYVISITGEEKLIITNQTWSGTVGATNAPERVESAGKFVPSPDADITRIDLNNSYTGNFHVGDNLSALGSDGVESLNVQDGVIFYETDTNKSYVLSSNTWTEL